MNFLSNIYTNSLSENEKNIKFWEEYLKNLNCLDFNVYTEKLTVPILVPIGNRILFRGELKHTNEVTVALGADYFAKCSLKQAEILRQHRIKDSQAKLQIYNKEKEYLESQLSFGSENVHQNQGQDIIEVCSEEEDKAWRVQHRERIRQYHQSKGRKQEVAKNEITDEELWLKLEELELKEELENELHNMDVKSDLDDNAEEYDSLIIKADDVSNVQKHDSDFEDEARITHNIPKQVSKINILQQVIERQKLLERKLGDLKYRERTQCKTEKDLLNRLDEIEQFDEMEDEIDRIDNIIYKDNEDGSISNGNNNLTEIKRCVAFVDEDDSETLEITFEHSKISPIVKPYDPEQGIRKPSDIYNAYSNLFANDTTSILKKSKCNKFTEDKSYDIPKVTQFNKKEEININTITVKDVFEKKDKNENILENDTRPTSLFKKRRQKQRS